MLITGTPKVLSTFALPKGAPKALLGTVNLSIGPPKVSLGAAKVL